MKRFKQNRVCFWRSVSHLAVACILSVMMPPVSAVLEGETNNVARMEALNDILDAVDGQIVSGPSALGLYDIQFETKEACQAAIPEFQESIENEMTCR